MVSFNDRERGKKMRDDRDGLERTTEEIARGAQSGDTSERGRSGSQALRGREISWDKRRPENVTKDRLGKKIEKILQVAMRRRLQRGGGK